MSAAEILNAAVRLSVGPGAEPRPGQAAALEQAAAALDTRTHASLVCPTGSGKSYVILAAAADRAVSHQERTLISTESLSLQKQVIDKDAPVIVQAVEELYGADILVSVLKGTSNYIDPRKLTATAAAFTGLPDERRPSADWAAAIQSATPTADSLSGADESLLRDLLVWAFEQYDAPGASGDRHSCPVPISGIEWEQVSASTAEAAGADDHWLFPKALEAKEAAAVADIVVVNHTLLAIQAATGMKILNGNTRYGLFDHVLVDEAHALPDEVRAQGASEVSGRVIISLARAVTRVSDSAEPWARDGEAIADALENHLRRQVGRDGTAKVAPGDDPLGDVGLVASDWAKKAARYVKPALSSPDVRTMLAAYRVQDRLEGFAAAITNVSTHTVGEARWVERAEDSGKFRSWTSAQSSPVDVSGKLWANLWHRREDLGGEVAAQEGEDSTTASTDTLVPLGVVCMSATLPTGFGYHAGLKAQTVAYPSPFAAAYQRSALLIPSGADPDIRGKLTSDGQYGPRFDVGKHAVWAAEQVVDLVDANEGSALVLSSSSKNGRAYVDALRRQVPHLTVLSQWDGGTPASLLKQWREDEASVLVGTRSLMTGVDGPGETCSLVILDRIPRRPSNPRDDARVEAIVARGDMDKWAADRLVYVADAAVLAEQAKGRLIRGMNDEGMVAVLDPRLLKYMRKQFPSYPEPTRKVYMGPLYEFGTQLTSTAAGVEFLRARRRTLVRA